MLDCEMTVWDLKGQFLQESLRGFSIGRLGWSLVQYSPIITGLIKTQIRLKRSGILAPKTTQALYYLTHWKSDQGFALFLFGLISD